MDSTAYNEQLMETKIVEGNEEEEKEGKSYIFFLKILYLTLIIRKS